MPWLVLAWRYFTSVYGFVEVVAVVDAAVGTTDPAEGGANILIDILGRTVDWRVFDDPAPVVDHHGSWAARYRLRPPCSATATAARTWGTQSGDRLRGGHLRG